MKRQCSKQNDNSIELQDVLLASPTLCKFSKESLSIKDLKFTISELVTAG
jgi:hypothetical protein